MKIETIAVRAGHRIDPGTRAVTTPIHMSTTFERDGDGSYPGGYVYSRGGNPNREALENCLAELEGGAAAAAFASGSAAAMSVLQALSPGDHVIAPEDVYCGTAHLLRDTFVPWGLQVSFVDMTDTENVERAVQPNTRLVWVETPSNPLLRITDITRVADIAHRAGVLCACDNTLPSPVLQRPFAHGADLVVHSTTKYLGGHGDVLGGAVIAKRDDAFFQKIRKIQKDGGAVPSPFECWLVLRGIRTLPYRMRAHAENAMHVAAFLSSHPKVESVHYPGLKDHPGHEVAARQMDFFGGIISFQLKGGKKKALAVAAKARLFVRATSLGGPISLIEHRASYEGPGTMAPDNLLRLSIGLEHPDDLIADLAHALA
ncbi:trans-sulfuration enzyme family protein [Desulforudis sp. 1088]|uniref:trans-sulfuration enzyme family protein n=1 Tax=unclassified Candidatus Desulforudis TaxID=2635950 RepID=UPI003CE50300